MKQIAMSKRRGTTLLLFLFLFVLLSWRSGWALEDENSDEKEHRFALPQEAFNAKHRRESSESGGTKVKWTAGDNSGRHASAPRSQRYWDEHGLGGENRPDYAKTDAEVLAERWGNKAGFTRLARTFFFLVIQFEQNFVIFMMFVSKIFHIHCFREQNHKFHYFRQ